MFMSNDKEKAPIGPYGLGTPIPAPVVKPSARKKPKPKGR
jgi:hypothetical protein